MEPQEINEKIRYELQAAKDWIGRLSQDEDLSRRAWKISMGIDNCAKAAREFSEGLCDIGKPYDLMQAVIGRMSLVPQGEKTSHIIFKAVGHTNNAMLLLPGIGHDVFRKTGEWVEPVECMGGN